MQTIRKQNLLAAALALAAVQSALPVSAGEPAAKRYNDGEATGRRIHQRTN